MVKRKEITSMHLHATFYVLPVTIIDSNEALLEHRLEDFSLNNRPELHVLISPL